MDITAPLLGLRSARPVLQALTAMALGFPPLGMGRRRSLEAEQLVQKVSSAEEEQRTGLSVPLDSVLQEAVAQTAHQDHIVVEGRSPATVLLGTSAPGQTQNPIHGPHRVQWVAIVHMVPLWLCLVPLEPWEKRAALYQGQSRPLTAQVASQAGSVLSTGAEPRLALLVTTAHSSPQLRYHVLEALGPLMVSW